jgi:NitT/TauT family transport system ATP-binding protein
VQLPLRIAGVDVDTSAARARDALDVVGLRGHEHKLPKQLSGGMRMRVSVARALVTNPATFLFDEPFAAVDEIKREALNEMLLNIHQQQHFSAAFVTHSVSEAVFLPTAWSFYRAGRERSLPKFRSRSSARAIGSNASVPSSSTSVDTSPKY